MSREIEHVRQLFSRRLEEVASTSFYGWVVSIDEEEQTCDIQFNNVIFRNVLLYVKNSTSKYGWILIPKQGSMVIVSRLAGTNRLYVEMFSEVDRVKLTIGEETSFTLDAEGMAMLEKEASMSLTQEGFSTVIKDTNLKTTEKGVTLKNGSYGLLKTLNDLCDAIMALTVTTGVGPSGMPINMAQFQQIKEELTNYLEE